MDVRFYEIGAAIANKEQEMELIGCFPAFFMYKNIEFGGFVEIDGEVYRMCMYSPKKDTLGVERVEQFESKPEAIESDEFTCPFCKSVDHDAWELPDDEGETYCGSCSSDLSYKRLYASARESDCRYVVEPLKISDYTKLN